jgi:hypothetical protein
MAITHVDRYLVDDKSITRCSNAARVAVLGLGDAESSVESIKKMIDPPLIGPNYSISVFFEPGPPIFLLNINRVLRGFQPDIGGACVSD